ncbi:NADH:ubiquinone reductase (Na(+)-transporting) subunit C [Rhodohalobacter sp. 614A]|uniref:NADH:ubiquinone reductase (Na(+)-transporting) subunit C n=1 Tax=Rhodohalobacter sp. 614A TaxID=2908649 RepID=UPI001F2A71D9|nr:NADH:ubiquinone reductase (Na(+)-transporting) subunit C [Rhodohalobacter sp. 614A]
MDVNKNSYTFMFAAIMVIVVAALLSFAATTLKPYQDENERLEKMQSILSSIKVEVSREEAAELYPEYIVQELVVSNHEEKPGIEAFNVDLTKEVRKSNIEREAPLYIAEKEGQRFFVIPIRGTGLWGPIWGYISLQEDVSTLYGAVFDHQGETPGLGAEIATAAFETQFEGKEILDDSGNLIGIDVRKGDASTQYQVDGISGGTITSEGVEAMILDCLESYIPFLKDYAATYSTAGSEL